MPLLWPAVRRHALTDHAVQKRWPITDAGCMADCRVDRKRARDAPALLRRSGDVGPTGETTQGPIKQTGGPNENRVGLGDGTAGPTLGRRSPRGLGQRDAGRHQIQMAHNRREASLGCDVATPEASALLPKAADLVAAQPFMSSRPRGKKNDGDRPLFESKPCNLPTFTQWLS